MDVYFCGSIRGGDADVGLYAELIDILGEHGTVLTEHVGREDAHLDPQVDESDDGTIHEQDMAWLRRADAVVAEVTAPSLGVGYEVGRAVEWETPVLGLYRPDGDHALSAMIRGDDAVRVVEYDRPAEIEDTLAAFLEAHR